MKDWPYRMQGTWSRIFRLNSYYLSHHMLHMRLQHLRMAEGRSMCDIIHQKIYSSWNTGEGYGPGILSFSDCSRHRGAKCPSRLNLYVVFKWRKGHTPLVRGPEGAPFRGPRKEKNRRRTMDRELEEKIGFVTDDCYMELILGKM